MKISERIDDGINRLYQLGYRQNDIIKIRINSFTFRVLLYEDLPLYHHILEFPTNRYREYSVEIDECLDINHIEIVVYDCTTESENGILTKVTRYIRC